MNRRTLKIIALITMTIDHIGMILFPHERLFRIIGRISFPIFSYFVAEGAKYTSSRLKYILLMAACEGVCLLGYYIERKEIYFSIMMTFIISVVIISFYDIFLKYSKKGGTVTILSFAGFGAVLYIVAQICVKWGIMYGFWGCVMPLMAYMREDKFGSILFFTLGIYLQSDGSSLQSWALMAVPLLLMYDGKKIKTKKWEKYFYYIYYPLHIGVLYLIGEFIG